MKLKSIGMTALLSAGLLVSASAFAVNEKVVVMYTNLSTPATIQLEGADDSKCTVTYYKEYNKNPKIATELCSNGYKFSGYHSPITVSLKSGVKGVKVTVGNATPITLSLKGENNETNITTQLPTSSGSAKIEKADGNNKFTVTN